MNPERRAIEDWVKTASEIRRRVSSNVVRSIELLNSSEGNVRLTQWLAGRSRDAIAISRALLQAPGTSQTSSKEVDAGPALADDRQARPWRCYHCGGSAYRPLKPSANGLRTVECLACGRSSPLTLTDTDAGI